MDSGMVGVALPAAIDLAVERSLAAATDLLDADWATVLLVDDPSRPDSTETVLRAARSAANHQLERYRRLTPPNPPLTWIASNGSLFAGDAPARALLPAIARLLGVRASLVVGLPPLDGDLKAGDFAGSGALLLERSEGRPFHADDLERARRMAARIATTIDRAARRRRVLDHLAETMDSISAAVGVSGVLRALVVGSLGLGDWTGIRLEAGAVGAAPMFLSAVSLTSNQIVWTEEPFVTDAPLYRQVAAGGDAAVVNLEVTAAHPSARYGCRDGLIVPIRTRRHAVGVLSVASKHRHIFDERSIAVLQFLADHAGGLVEHARIDNQAVEQDGYGAAQRQLSEAARAAHDRLAAALEASGTIIVTYSLDGVVTSVDGNARAILGLSTPEIVGRSLWEFLPVDEHGLTTDHLDGRLAGQFTRRRFETRVLHRAGHTVPVLIVTGPQFEDQRHTGHAVAMTDLTDLMSLQRERTAALAARSLAEGAVHTGRAIAHKLGSPLSSILVLAEILVADPRLPPQSKADMRLLFDEAVRAGALLHRFSRITRYEEIDTPAGPQLDVERSSMDEQTSESAP